MTTTPPQGVDRPAGADAGTYTYNSCGYFENTYYTWSPTTHTATPKTEPTYNYNSTTGKCDALFWHWSPVTNSWFQQTVSVDTPPNGDPCVGKPAPQPVTPPTSDASAAPTTTPTGSGGGTVDTTGTNNQTVNDTNNATLNNTIGSTATTGNAVLLGNVSNDGTTGGASSGTAQAIANVFNLLQSSSSMGAGVATFVANVDGDVQGDLVIDPNTLQPANSTTTLNNNVDVNIQNDGSIKNDITLAAQSGDATVQHNINAGDATSGNAQAIANVVNMMNSLVSASQSFLGVININGNLNGNILMPQNFLDSLIASNAPHENVSISQDTLNQLSGQVTNDQSITNNVTSKAVSGDATATNNVNSGALSSASSGTANTNVTIFNLANNDIIGGNTMLVFVNVLGKWVGVIMDAPPGATAAALGGGVTTTTAVNNNANYNVDNNGTITNNIDVSARSGDATVNKNINAGDAKSGNAMTAVNLANLISSHVNLTGWFGILFINVFGSWNGNFGVLKNKPVPTGAGASNNTGAPTQMFNFVPTGSAGHSSVKPAVLFGNPTTGSGGTGNFSDTDLTAVANKVLAASIAKPGTSLSKQAVQHDHNMTMLLGGALFAIGLLLAAADIIRSKSRV